MMNQVTGSMEMKPATPAATKYGILGAVIFGGAGVAMLVMSGNRSQAPGAPAESDSQ